MITLSSSHGTALSEYMSIGQLANLAKRGSNDTFCGHLISDMMDYTFYNIIYSLLQGTTLSEFEYDNWVRELHVHWTTNLVQHGFTQMTPFVVTSPMM